MISSGLARIARYPGLSRAIADLSLCRLLRSPPVLMTRPLQTVVMAAKKSADIKAFSTNERAAAKVSAFTASPGQTRRPLLVSTFSSTSGSDGHSDSVLPAPKAYVQSAASLQLEINDLQRQLAAIHSQMQDKSVDAILLRTLSDRKDALTAELLKQKDALTAEVLKQKDALTAEVKQKDREIQELNEQMSRQRIAGSAAAAAAAADVVNTSTDTGTTAEPLPRAALKALIGVLTTKGILLPADQWRSAGLETSFEILGLGYLPKLCGRGPSLDSILAHTSVLCKSGTDTRKPLNLVSGIPGTGKTRMLYEAAKKLLSETKYKHNLAVLAVTFNHVQNCMMSPREEIQMMGYSPEVPVVLRLMHGYMASSQYRSWGYFAGEALKEIDALPSRERQFFIKDVIEIIAEHQRKSKILLLFDETLRWLELSHRRDAPSESYLSSRVESMVSAVCRATNEGPKAAIFSAFASSFLSNPESSTGRAIKTTHLLPLNMEGSRKLIRSVVSYRLPDLAEGSGLTEEKVISILDALAVGGLPRAAEMMHDALSILPDLSKKITVPNLVSSTHALLAQRYNVPWDLVVLALSGIETWPPDKLLPGSRMTANKAVYLGHLPEPRLDSKNVPISLTPVLLLSRLLHGKLKDDAELRAASECFASLALIRPQNLWGEFVVRILILRSHLLLHRELTGDSAAGTTTTVNTTTTTTVNATTTTTTAAAVATSTRAAAAAANGILTSHSLHSHQEQSRGVEPTVRLTFPRKELRSVLELFPGSNKGHVNGCMPGIPVMMAWPLRHRGMTFRKNKPPSPGALMRNPSLMQRVFVSRSRQESEIDILLYLHRKKAVDAVAAGDFIAVGIQCKWSGEESTTKLNCGVVERARSNFQSKMEAQGWRKDQLVLVVLAHRHTEGMSNFQSRVGDSVAVLAKGSGIDEWLGPSLRETAECLHAAHTFSNPYDAWDEEGEQL